MRSFFIISLLCGLIFALPADRTVGGYNITQAKNNLLYAYSAYCQPPELSNWGCFWCNSTLPLVVKYYFENSSTNTFGFAGYNTEHIVFSFRGSRALSLQNIITNLESQILVEYPNAPGMRVASGFWKVYQAIRPAVRRAYTELTSKFPNLPVMVTGHSLGSAISTFAGLDLAEQYGAKIDQWTYGTPRVGDEAFSQYIFKKFQTVWRTVNQNDIAPHYPFRWQGFFHPPTEVWFKKDFMNFVLCDSSGEDPNCSDSVKITSWSILDHLMYFGFPQVVGRLYGC